MDEDYERERQENIRKNQELLLSLGLHTSRNGTAPRRKREVKEQEESPESRSSSPRSSARLSARPRASFAPQSKKRKVISKPLPQLGTRKSARLSQPGYSRRHTYEEGDGDSGIAIELDDTPRARISATALRRLQNPVAPVRIDEQDYEEKEYDRAPLPARDENGNVIFENNNRHFQPNVTPDEMLKGGIFGGTAFRPFFSSVLGHQISSSEDMAEFPSEWYSGLDPEAMLISLEYEPKVNRFGVKAGQTLEEWEKNGWVRRQDPRGWWQWYFRFYLGRRTSDDARQISRFLKACGPSGRFKRSLVTKIHHAGARYDDETISPVVRQTLFHWAYALTEADYEAYLP